MLLALNPVLAAIDVGQVIGLIVLVISVLSWFVQAIKGNQAQPPNRPRPAGNPQPRTDLEQFLRQVMETNQPKPKPRPPEPAPENRPRTNPAAGRNKLKNKPKRPPIKTPEPVRLADERPSPPGSIARQHLPTSTIGSSLRTHMDENRLQQEAEWLRKPSGKNAGNRVNNAVQKDLGGGLAASQDNSLVIPVHPIMTWLQQPGAIQNALVLQEILQRPKSLRRK